MRGLGITGLNLEKTPSRPCESGTSDCGDSVINLRGGRHELPSFINLASHQRETRADFFPL